MCILRGLFGRGGIGRRSTLTGLLGLQGDYTSNKRDGTQGRQGVFESPTRQIPADHLGALEDTPNATRKGSWG